MSKLSVFCVATVAVFSLHTGLSLSSSHREVVLGGLQSPAGRPFSPRKQTCEYGWDDGTIRAAYYYLDEEDVIASRFVAGEGCDFDTLFVSEIGIRILTPDDYPPYGWPDPDPDPVKVKVWLDTNDDGVPDGFPVFTDTTVRLVSGWVNVLPALPVFVKSQASFWIGFQNLSSGGNEGVCVDSSTDYPEHKWARESGTWIRQDYCRGDHLIRVYLDGNSFPSLQHPGNRIISEGENLSFSLSSTDPDGDDVSMEFIDSPPGATLLNSTFDWTPNYCQSGEHRISIVAIDDGTPPLADTIEVVVIVNNANRSPSVALEPLNPHVYAGNPIVVDVFLSDPDWTECHDDTVSISFTGDGDLTDYGNGSAQYTRTTTLADTGVYNTVFVVTDGEGAADTVNCTYTVETPLFGLAMKTVYAYPSQEGVVFPITMRNDSAVAAFQMLIQMDLTAVDVFAAITPDSTFIAPPSPNSGWYYAPYVYPPEYLSFIPNAGGHPDWIQVIGIMDMDVPPVTNPIPPGEEQLLFCLVLDILPNAAGHTALFAFRTYDCGDNTLTGPDGYTLWGPTQQFTPSWVCPERPDSLRSVMLEFGSVVIQEVLVGDLNLNGIAFETGDAVVFVNYFQYGESALVNPAMQTPASDINQDGICWNISDLVLLLNTINEKSKSLGIALAEPVGVVLSPTSDGIAVSVQSASPIGGAFLRARYDPAVAEASEPVLGNGVEMTLVTGLKDGELRAALFDWESNPLPPGNTRLFTIPMKVDLSSIALDENLLAIEEFSVSDASGNVLDVSISYAGFSLSDPRTMQVTNFPNPFSEETRLSFAVPAPSHVEVTIYDPTGRVVRRLVDSEMAAGTCRVSWDGLDGLGGVAPSGIYFYHVTVGTVQKSGKMLLLR